MNTEEYNLIIGNAKRMDRNLFDLSSEENINKLEAILDEESRKHGETMIGVPLVRPYGGLPVSEYILLPERVYNNIRVAMRSGEVGRVHQEIGVPYDKERFGMNREQLHKGLKIPVGYIEFMEEIRERAEKIKVCKRPTPTFY